MEKESDIQAFAERLRDRFGRIPHEGEELIRVVSLRGMAKQFGYGKSGTETGENDSSLHLGRTYSLFPISGIRQNTCLSAKISPALPTARNQG